MSGHHISSAKFLWGVGISLFVLTFITVAVTWIQIPEPWNVVVAISIAVVKALIVAAFFMLFIMSVVFFGLLIGITLLDTMYRTDPIPSF